MEDAEEETLRRLWRHGGYCLVCLANFILAICSKEDDIGDVVAAYPILCISRTQLKTPPEYGLENCLFGGGLALAPG